MDQSFILMLSNLLQLQNNFDPSSSLLSESHTSTTSPAATLSSTSAASLLFFIIASVLSYAATLHSSKSSSSSTSTTTTTTSTKKESSDLSISAFRALSTEHIWTMEPPVRDSQWRSSYGISYLVFASLVDQFRRCFCNQK